MLYNSRDVRKAIITLFGDSGKRRVAISAFVGEGAEAFLPRPKGLELYCWPKAGGTNPNTIRKLIARGAKVFFADALHIKAYWSKDKGAIITSANLSTNALGSGDLKETGILLASNDLDIDRLIHSFKSRPASAKELRQLDRLHKKYRANNRGSFESHRTVQSFEEWFESPFREQWKLAVITGEVNLAKKAKTRSKEDYGVSKPKHWISSKCRDYNVDDWVLTFWVKNGRPVELSWLTVDFFVEISPSDNAYSKQNPCQYVQVWSRSRYPPPPFKPDRTFARALAKAIQDFGLSRIERLAKAPKSLVDLICENWS